MKLRYPPSRHDRSGPPPVMGAREVCMTRQRLVGLVLLLGALLLSAVPIRGAAQTNAEFFEQVVTGELSAPLLAGPYDFLLEQTPGTLSAFKAGVDVRNFVAHAAFINPEVD